MDSSSLRPAPSRRKSSNLLASLARQNTLSEREKERERQAEVTVTSTGMAPSLSSGSTTTIMGAVPAFGGREQQYAYGHNPQTASISSMGMPAGPGGGLGPGSGQGQGFAISEKNAHSYTGTGIPSSSSSLSAPTTSSAPSAHNTPSSGSSFGAALDHLRQLLQKRMATFGYLKRAHEGKVHWFNTILLQRAELEGVFDNQKMAKRTVRFAVLGMSLSVLLEITAAHDFLRGLLSLLQEYDTITDENFKAKTKNLFKAGKTKRPSGTADYPLSVQESGDLSYFFSPNIPFDMDYFQVLYTLCDILSEVYIKILSFLGPPTSASSPQPNPVFGGSSPSGTSAFPATISTGSSIYAGSAGGLSAASAGSTFAGVDRRSAGLSPMLVEVVLKIDSKLKKIIFLVTKELDAVARSSIKDELGLLSDSLSGVAVDGMF